MPVLTYGVPAAYDGDTLQNFLRLLSGKLAVGAENGQNLGKRRRRIPAALRRLIKHLRAKQQTGAKIAAVYR